MAKHIRNINELEKALMPTMVKMVDELAKRVYETLNYFLQEYYNSYDPKSYRRQYNFLRSAVKVESRIKGNKVVASVYIDTDSMVETVKNGELLKLAIEYLKSKGISVRA